MKRDFEFSAGAFACLGLMALFAVGFLVLASRLKSVQVDGAAEYGRDISQQSVRRILTAGPRGRILDCHGNVLAENRARLSLVCHLEKFQRRRRADVARAVLEAATAVGAVIGRGVTVTTNDVVRHMHRALPVPFPVWRDVTPDEMARFSEREGDFPGFGVEEDLVRRYPCGRTAAHAIGYVGRDPVIAGDEGDVRITFREDEMVGRAGVERYYDGYLRGVPGETDVQVDACGYASRRWTVTEPQRGPDLRLTIDLEIQRAADAALAGLRGACVVIDPRDGAVLAFASAPGYDLNEFVPALSPEHYDALLRDPAKPLVNRASGGTFAPGSTFKPVTALAGLTIGYPVDQECECTGAFEGGGRIIRCARRWGHGSLDVRHALKESCNVFFCSLGYDIGTNAVCSAARALGLGRKTGIDFTDDRVGVVPDAMFKERMYGEPWYAADLASMSIGQGMLLVTPLQMARVAGAIGTGRLVVPRLRADRPPAFESLPFREEDLKVVREGMRMVVDGGTGWRGAAGVAAFVIGKTGTAEVGAGSRKRKNTWFIAYAVPDETTRAMARGREAAVALLVENGQSGGGTAAPRVARILKAIFGTRPEI